MKNPLQHVKHLMKDPINTIAEANERKKEIMPWFFGSVALAVVGCILGGFVSALMVIGLVGVFATMFFGFLLFVLKKAKDKFKALTCNDCNTMAEIKTPEDLASYVSYYITGDVAQFDGITHPSSTNGVVSAITAKATASAVAYIELKCPKCGKTKKLKYSITHFKCELTEKNVRVPDVELVKSRLEQAVKEVVNDYNDSEKRGQIPFTVQSIYHPNYENKEKLGASGARANYKGVTITYRRTAQELVEGFFIRNELNGTIKEISEEAASK